LCELLQSSSTALAQRETENEEREVNLVVHCKKDRYDVLIDRSTMWGNPFSHKTGTKAQFQVATRKGAIRKFEEWFLARPEMIALAKRVLKGKVLGCWCRPLACHGDVLSRIANE